MSHYQEVLARVLDGQVTILDGAIGTELERLGVPMDKNAWCGLAAIEHLEVLREIHKEYILAGADIITAHTYSSSRIMMDSVGLGHMTQKVNREAVRIAKSAASLFGSKKLLVAGSLSHRVPILDGSNDPSLGKVRDSAKEMVDILVEEKCDFILLEMMYNPVRILPTFEIATETDLPVWAGFSARRGPDGEVLSYHQESDIPFKEIVKVISHFEIDVAGIMHTPADLVGDAIDILRDVYSGPLMVYPDSGFFQSPNWQFIDIMEPSKLLDFGSKWSESGVKVLGGCCGLSPRHIKQIAKLKS